MNAKNILISLTLVAFVLIMGLSGCDRNKDSGYIIGSDGGKYYLIEEEVVPSEDNGWVGHVNFYRKENGNTVYIMTFDSNPPIFQNIHRPIK